MCSLWVGVTEAFVPNHLHALAYAHSAILYPLQTVALFLFFCRVMHRASCIMCEGRRLGRVCDYLLRGLVRAKINSVIQPGGLGTRCCAASVGVTQHCLFTRLTPPPARTPVGDCALGTMREPSTSTSSPESISVPTDSSPVIAPVSKPKLKRNRIIL
ncbi:hypothetical protein BC834DRAFT_194846 [Gloeopeniophorella convolvens]|nr:hypothetical protein BC834DRAFT_194846 [Gloeopeniophorella convolvens]